MKSCKDWFLGFLGNKAPSEQQLRTNFLDITEQVESSSSFQIDGTHSNAAPTEEERQEKRRQQNLDSVKDARDVLAFAAMLASAMLLLQENDDDNCTARNEAINTTLLASVTAFLAYKPISMLLSRLLNESEQELRENNLTKTRIRFILDSVIKAGLTIPARLLAEGAINQSTAISSSTLWNQGIVAGGSAIFTILFSLFAERIAKCLKLNALNVPKDRMKLIKDIQTIAEATVYLGGVTAMGPLLARDSDHCSSIDGFNALTQMTVTSGLSMAAWKITSLLPPIEYCSFIHNSSTPTCISSLPSSAPFILEMLATVFQTALTIPAVLIPAGVMSHEPIKDTFLQQLIIVLLVSSAFGLLQQLFSGVRLLSDNKCGLGTSQDKTLSTPTDRTTQASTGRRDMEADLNYPCQTEQKKPSFNESSYS